jgi:hypothetical protein
MKTVTRGPFGERSRPAPSGPATRVSCPGLRHESPVCSSLDVPPDLGMVLPPSRTRWTALALNSSVKLRLGLRGFRSSPMLDTVPTSPKVSTGTDQAQVKAVLQNERLVRGCRLLVLREQWTLAL